MDKYTKQQNAKKRTLSPVLPIVSAFILFWFAFNIFLFHSVIDYERAGGAEKNLNLSRKKGKGKPVAVPILRNQEENPLNVHLHLPAYPIDHRKGIHDAAKNKAVENIRNMTQSQLQQQTAGESSSRLALSKEAVEMCHQTLWHTLESTTIVLPNNETFVTTGDIKDLFLRDSAAQIHPLIIPNIYNGKSLVQTDPNLERIVSGLIQRTARYIRHDPYANSFKIDDSLGATYNTFERTQLGRNGYISTWNYELDSACYYMRMIYFFYASFPSHPVLRLREVQEAIEMMIDLWTAEQRHEEDQYPAGPLFDCENCGKPYRYNPAELKRNGKGTETNPNTGMTWSGFRPSDDPCEYGYLVPSNMFAVVALQYVEELAMDKGVWDNPDLAKKAKKLKDDIQDGIEKHGIVDHEEYGQIYAYEVDGLGNSLLMDDANIPNLMSLPYLGYDYDPEIYENTKKFILSQNNPTFHRGTNNFTGDIEGYGSPHTERWIQHAIWPMSIAMQALVSDDANEKISFVETLVKATAGTGWMHESFDANHPEKFTRPWFCWPDSLFAELVMSLTYECPQASVYKYKVKEWQDVEHPMKGSVFFVAD